MNINSVVGGGIRSPYDALTEKPCAPLCTVACVHKISYIDFWRAPQTINASPVPLGGAHYCTALHTRNTTPATNPAPA